MRRLPRVSALIACLLVTATLVPFPAASGAQSAVPDSVIGFSLGPLASQQRAAGQEVDRIADIGANTVSLSVWWDADEESSVVRPFNYTVSDAELRLAIQAVRTRGLVASILPLFMCTSCESTWRGSFQPQNKTLFYESYRGMIERYARIAEQEGASLLFIGSEMTSLQGDTEQWRRVAATARDNYSGEIVYDVNWDAIDGVKFWDSVDIPSISAYFPLSEERSPSLETLKKAWHSSEQKSWTGKSSVAEVQRLANRTGKAVLFGEAGYRSRDYGTRLPFDYTATEGDANPQLQADAYQALIETFYGKPYWRGVLFWEWDLNGARPHREKSFTPRSKPAEGVIKAWYADGLRPTEERPRLSAPSGGGDGPAGGGESPSDGGSAGGGSGSQGRTGSGTQSGRPGSAAQAGDGEASPGVDPATGEPQAAGSELGGPPAASRAPASTVAAIVIAGLLLIVVLGAMAKRGA